MNDVKSICSSRKKWVTGEEDGRPFREAVEHREKYSNIAKDLGDQARGGRGYGSLCQCSKRRLPRNFLGSLKEFNLGKELVVRIGDRCSLISELVGDFHKTVQHDEKH